MSIDNQLLKNLDVGKLYFLEEKYQEWTKCQNVKLANKLRIVIEVALEQFYFEQIHIHTSLLRVILLFILLAKLVIKVSEKNLLH